MEKRYYSRCMYGNYIPSDFKASGSVLEKSGPSYQPRRKIALAGISVLLLLIFGILMFGCKPQQVIVEKEKVVYQTKDSLVYVDSTVYVPVEVYRDYSLDTLVLKTSLAESRSWLDTNSLYLVGEIRNLKAVQVKYIEKEVTKYRDSIVEKEKPVPYEVEVVKTKTPKWAWITLVWAVITVASIAWSVYKRFRKI